MTSVQSSSHQSRWHQPKRSGTLHLLWEVSSSVMPQSARSLDNRFSKASSFFGRLSKRVRQSHSLCLSTKFYPGIQSRHRSHLPVRCRDLGSLSEADRAACVVSRTLLAPHPWQQMTRLRVNRRSPQESQSAQHRAQVLQVQLPWAGHVTRVEDVHMPKAVFFSELQEGKRDRDALRKRYKDKLKRQLAQAETAISHGSRRPQTETAGAHQ